jgi:hypothetical protein
MGARRRVQPGDHVDPAHELVSHFPTHFQSSGERADVVVLSSPTPEVLRQREQDRRRRMPRLVQVVRWRCENCLVESDAEAVIPPPLQALDVASSLEDAGDLIERQRVQYDAHRHQQAHLDGQAEERRIYNQMRTEHTLCPADAELHPLPEMPEPDPSKPIPVWSGPTSLGRR